MPVTIKTKEEIEILREGGRKLAAIRDELAALAKPGVSAQKLEDRAAELFKSAGGEPSFLNYRSRKAEKPYPACTCISVNDALVHGLPHPGIIFKEGDLVGIDVGMKYKGLFTDTAVTVPVGKIDAAARQLLDTTKKALLRGIDVVKEGVTTGDIGFAIESFVAPFGYGIVRVLAGHGVGYAVHEEPLIPNFGRRGEGIELTVGMVIAIEPMLNEGAPDVKLASDGFTFVTKDGSRSAHFEHTLVVTKKGAEVLTL